MFPVPRLLTSVPGDKYILEFERNEDGTVAIEHLGPKFSDRAKAAQNARWQRIFAKFAPMETIREAMLAGPTNPRPYLIYYGWPYTEEFMFRYAQRHQIVSRVKFKDVPFMAHATITDDDLKDRKVRQIVFSMATSDAIVHIRDRCGVRMERGCPLGEEYVGILALYSNYSMDKRYPPLERLGIDEIIGRMDEVMSEVEGHKSVLQWYYDWDNDIGIFRTPA